jgi:hypothetical protein
MKRLPNADKQLPINTAAGYPGSISVLSHTPATTNAEPIVQPNLEPYLSRNQLVGKAAIGWKMVKIKAFAVTTYLE